MKNTSDLSPLIGLVACGGQSDRMKTDKGLINYHGFPQRYFVYDLLTTVCEKVFLSINCSQENTINPEYDYISDDTEFEGHGPISVLLSAFKKHPDCSFLLLGVDYPFLKMTDIKKLIDFRDIDLNSICYVNAERIPEPLIAIYENSSIDILEQRFKEGKFSLRDFHNETESLFLAPENFRRIRSVDTAEEQQHAVAELNYVTR